MGKRSRKRAAACGGGKNASKLFKGSQGSATGQVTSKEFLISRQRGKRKVGMNTVGSAIVRDPVARMEDHAEESGLHPEGRWLVTGL